MLQETAILFTRITQVDDALTRSFVCFSARLNKLTLRDPEQAKVFDAAMVGVHGRRAKHDA
jgi:hypothetical protein